MPRYLVQREFDPMSEEAMQEVLVRSKQLVQGDFSDVTWEHSHVCSDETGLVTSYCVYEAASEERVHAHSRELGGHTLVRIHELVGDIYPAEIQA
jgi:Nickel responsive protein SCO4226-like